MKNIVLSKRMEAVVNMVSPQSFAIADVGCDHAYVSIALIKRGIAKRVIAMDVRKGPLEIAAKNVAAYGAADYIELRLGDGLERLRPGEVDAIILAGMGGLLMKHILKQGQEILSGGERRPVLVLQPQSDIREVRIFLYQNAYHIVQEQMLVEEGKYYTVIKAEPAAEGKGETTFTETEWIYGRYGLEHKDPVLYSFLKKERDVFEAISERLERQQSEKDSGQIPQKTRERMDSIKTELAHNKEALTYFDIDTGYSDSSIYSEPKVNKYNSTELY